MNDKSQYFSNSTPNLIFNNEEGDCERSDNQKEKKSGEPRDMT